MRLPEDLHGSTWGRAHREQEGALKFLEAIPAELRSVTRRYVGIVLAVLLLVSSDAMAQEAHLELLPIRPFSLDVVYHQILEPHAETLFSIQGGVTVLDYGHVEMRGLYRYYQLRSADETFDEHVLLLNPRWNNFIDFFDFPHDNPISRFLRHALFGPLEDRAVPYLGALVGMILPIDHPQPGYWYGGQLGVRFPVAVGLELDFGVEYSRFGGSFPGQDSTVSQWVFTTGIVF